MVISENGIIVGFIDDSTLETEDITSERLESLIQEWKTEGLGLMEAQQGELGEGQASGDLVRNFPWEPKYVNLFIVELENEGFDVQTA